MAREVISTGMDPAASDASRGDLSRRAALGVLGAGALAIGLWPRKPRTMRSVPAGRTVIDYWEKWTGPEGESIQRVVDRFNQSQDRIWVRRIPVSDIMNKAMVAIGGGDPPDVLGLYSYNIAQFAESRAAIALEDLAGSGGATSTARRIDPESYVPGVRRLLTHEGRQWAGVNTCYTLGLYYNRALFREVGMDPDRPPRTVNELDAAAERLTARGLGGRIERAGFLPNMPAWWPYFWPTVFGGKLYDAARNRAVLTDDGSVAAYEWVAGYPKRLGAAASSEFGNSYNRSYHTPQDPFMAERVAMIVQGPWIANFMRLYAPKLDYGCAPVPVAEPLYDAEAPLGMLEADVLMIPRGCRHPEAAYEFLCFTQTQDVQEQLATEHAKSSPMREVSAGFAASHPNRYVKVHDAIAKSPRVRILPQTRVWQPYADSITSAFEAIWNGADVPSTLRRIETRAQAMMDAAALRRNQRGGHA